MSTTQVGNHDFELKHFNGPTFCATCSKFIWGLGKQGYRCKKCYYPCHKKCMETVPADCTGVQKSWFTSDKKIGKVKYAYQSMQDDELTLNVGDQVVVIEQMANGWCRCEHEGTVGLFPSQYIEIIKVENYERTSKGSDDIKIANQTNSNYQTTSAYSENPQQTETTVVSTPTTATNAPAAAMDRSRRFTIGAKGETRTLRSVDAAQVDFKKVEKLNKLQDQIDAMAKKDFGDLSKAVSKYQIASEGLSDAGAKVASEFSKIAEKYKDSPFSPTYAEFGAFVKTMEEQRHQWQKGLNNFAVAIKDFEEMRNINATEKAIKDQNKKFDAHVKSQIESATQIPNSDNAGFSSALTELNTVCKEIDNLRDQMAAHLEYHKNMLLHKAAMEWTLQMQSHSIFLETVTEQAKHYYPQWRQITASPPQAPPSKWMEADLKNIRTTGSVTTTTTTQGTISRGTTQAQLGAPSPLTPPQSHQTMTQSSYDNNQPHQGKISLPPPIISQQVDNGNGSNLAQSGEEDEEEGPARRRDRVGTLPSNKNLATATPPKIRQPSASMPTPPVPLQQQQHSVWKEYATKEGRKYYYNTATKQTTWEAPLEFRGRTA